MGNQSTTLPPSRHPWLDRAYSFVRFDVLFNLLYSIRKDPFNVSKSKYELRKREIILNFISKKSPKNALDIGCGTGILTSFFALHCQRITAVDFSQKAISIAKCNCKNNLNINFVIADIRKFESEEKFDLFICSEILYYMNSKDIDFTMRKVKRLAEPEAWLIQVGRANDNIVAPILENHFRLLERVKEYGWWRPFAVSLFAVQPK